MEHSSGIIIRLTKLTETSLIVHWCTEQHGLIKTVAKGARRPRSIFSGKLDLFFHAELDWVRSRKSELHTLREVAVSEYRENLRKKYTDTLVASYFGELLAHVAEPDHPVPELYDLLCRGIAYLGENGADMRGLIHYENEMVRLLGVAHQRTSASSALQNAYGHLPRGREACIDALGGF
ncbi:MAG: DNA repair protein RecO [Akkermansiaceae bacterium]